MPTPGATTIMVIRHAEKPGEYNGIEYGGISATGSAHPKSLSTVGWQRAGALVTLFAPPWGPKTLALPQPQFIYAAQPGPPGDNTPSRRPFETILAVAAALKLEVHAKHHRSAYQAMVEHALAECGTVLISWQHQEIPLIGQALLSQTGTVGITVPTTWPAGPQGPRYDLVWMFSRSAGSGPITAFAQIAQMLLPGDAPV
jgi:hypothetical protein